MRQAVTRARATFERWVRSVHGKFVTFQAGDHRAAVTASLGPDRALRKTYEHSLARAQALGAEQAGATGSAPNLGAKTDRRLPFAFGPPFSM